MKHVNIFMMKTGQGKVQEILLDGSLQIQCSPDLIPSPGQYVLAHNPASDSPLPVSAFFADSSPNGFRCAPLPIKCQPGDLINLRGPIGHGYSMPTSAKRIALIACEESFARLQGLIPLALKQNAEIVLVSDAKEIDIPEIIEIQPLQSLNEILSWADYVAIDVPREVRRTLKDETNLNSASATHPLGLLQLKEKLGKQDQAKIKYEAQVLIHTPMPCGAIAECGVCALTLNHEWKMICKEGPVFNLQDIL
jgi:hypothetical protein